MPSDEAAKPDVPIEKEVTLDPQEGEIIATRLAESQNALETLGKQIDEIFEDLPEEEKEKVLKAEDALGAGEITEEELLEQFSENPQERRVVELLIEGMHSVEPVQNLQEQYKPYEIQELSLLVDNLADRFNWDAFLEYYDSNTAREIGTWDNGLMSNALSTFASVRTVQQQRATGTITEEPYIQLEYYHRTIQAASAEWAKRGFLLDAPQSYSETENVEQIRQRRLELRERLLQEQKEIQDYANMKKTFRDLAGSYRFVDMPFDRVVNSLDVEIGYGYAGDTWKKYEYDPRYLDAVERFASKRRDYYVANDVLPMFGEDYEAHINRLRSIDGEAALAQITISGFEERPGETSVVTEETLRQELGSLVPACFLEKVELVVVTDRPEELDKDNPKIKTAGRFIPKFDNNGNLVNSRIEIYISPRVPEVADLKSKEVAEGIFKAVALHEFGHRIHHELTFADMQEWKNVSTKDTTAVTQYVVRARTKDETQGVGEDFCETYQLAVLNPGYLYIMSPERFNYMMGLLGRYISDEQRLALADNIKDKFEKHMQEMKNLAKLIEDNTREQENNEQ